MNPTKRGGGRRRWWVVATVAPVLASLALAGCGGSSGGGGSGGGNKAVTITYLTHWGPDQVKMLQADADAFHQSHPNITVKFNAVPFANLLTTLTTQAGSPNGPTIASIYSLWLPQMVQAGIADAAPADVASDVQTNWPANLVSAVTKGGSIRGIPNEVDLYALNYNKALFSAAGISAPPKTWAELTADAKKLTDKGKGQQGFGVITNWDSGVVHPWLSLVNSNGGQLLNGTTPNLTDPKVVAATKLYAQLVSDGSTVATMSSANANTTGPYLDNFTSGKTAMIIMANWWEASLKQAMGSKFSDVGVAPIPVGPSGTKPSAVSYSWLTMVNAKASADKRAAAWEFLKWLNDPTSGQSGSSAMADVLISMGIIPSRNSDITAHQAQLSDPFLSAYVGQLANSTPFPLVLGGAQMTVAIQKEIESVVFGKSSPDSAMNSAQTQVASILKNAASG